VIQEGSSMDKLRAKYVGLSCVLLLLGCQANNQVVDEAAVRQADQDWSKAAQTKKVDDWVAFYTDDAVILPPNAPKATGKEDIQKGIGELLSAPGLSISWEPEKVEVARSGDLAYTQGKYLLTMNDAKGKPMTDHGKTSEIWKKQPDGRWKCTVDMWSSDLPAMPQ
jgi:uncharacterized protein (TIGR02246 family)